MVGIYSKQVRFIREIGVEYGDTLADMKEQLLFHFKRKDQGDPAYLANK